MNWQNILYIILGVAIVWYGVRMIRGNPQMFSKENLSKSFFSIGILTLGLIAFITILVYLLRH